MNILSFDIEEWFHILDNLSTKFEDNWLKYDVRIHNNMSRIFSLLEKNNLNATFFVVGWIAEKYPEVIREIDRRGYQIGSHTHMHQLMYEQSKAEVNIDLYRSINTIQSITGKKVTCFRAPGFSLTQKNKWVFEILAENGITHDSSVFPAGRAHGGFPEFKSDLPSLVNIDGYFLKELPINTTKIFNKPIIFSGGGYFRIMPYFLIKNWTKKSEYVMTYFHPRDFDIDQPMINELSALRKFKSYVGINGCLNKLDQWLNDFEFIDLKTANNLIDWSKAAVIKI